VTGATGSGKSSGPARAIATTFLRNGFGGLVLTTKPDERATWEAYCAETGRSQDLRVFGPDSEPWRFNPLEHELKRAGAGAGLTENILNLLCTALEVSDRGSNAGSGREDSNYWRQATRTLLRNSIDLLAMGLGRVSVPELHRLIISAATSLEMLRSEEWRSSRVRTLASSEPAFERVIDPTVEPLDAERELRSCHTMEHRREITARRRADR
jgi:hypothetical protein